MRIRALTRDEAAAVWQIDRTESIREMYRHHAGSLRLYSAHFDMTGWPEGEPQREGDRLLDCFDHGGVFLGAFIGGRMIGAVVLDSRPMGPTRDQLQLKFLHVGHAHRGSGLGRRLFALAADHARRLGARSLYISATPSRRTVEFYQRLGCVLAKTPDPALFELEPEDIHLEYRL